jgi:hypothetical protein
VAGVERGAHADAVLDAREPGPLPALRLLHRGEEVHLGGVERKGPPRTGSSPPKRSRFTLFL